ncbi:hypothetical protein QBC40DRAFT_259975 [Triangularia verruculosa]|uniref:Uncharacterized protein n=1 Tax=Triangularia verruculosa TaxID=2587418 RepID=A0AAN6X6B6_9PEZI|nr:hypothetical protein QBC40DRAFT_259975 [Triangularia verruculosa]
MGKSAIRTVCKADFDKPASEQPTDGTPTSPPRATIQDGETVKTECLDWTGGGQIKNDDSADDIKNIDLTRVHYLSAPSPSPTPSQAMPSS